MIHAHYLSRIEDMFYTSLFNERQKAQNANANANNQQAAQSQPPQQQTPQMSTQFLEAVARGGNGMLNEQQKRALEGRRQSGQTPNNGNNVTTSSNGKSSQASDASLLQALKQNPQLVFGWIKQKEDGMKARLRAYCHIRTVWR
jgi:hypothetical protein